jgi:hypothetical protein
MTSYLSAVATYKPTECITGDYHIGFTGTDTDLDITIDGKVRAIRVSLLNPPFHLLAAYGLEDAAPAAEYNKR